MPQNATPQNWIRERGEARLIPRSAPRILLVMCAAGLVLGGVSLLIAFSSLNRFVGILLPLAFGVVWVCALAACGVLSGRATSQPPDFEAEDAAPQPDAAHVEATDGGQALARKNMIEEIRSVLDLAAARGISPAELIAEAQEPREVRRG